MESFGERLRRLRKENKMTQDDVANFLGVERVTISRYEAGAIAPKGGRLKELAELFNCSVSYLLCMTDDPIDYSDPDFIASISPELLRHFDGNAKKAYLAQKAIDDEALNERPGQYDLPEEDPDIQEIARARKGMTPEQRTRMMKIIKASFEEFFDGDGKPT